MGQLLSLYVHLRPMYSKNKSPDELNPSLKHSYKYKLSCENIKSYGRKKLNLYYFFHDLLFTRVCDRIR